VPKGHTEFRVFARILVAVRHCFRAGQARLNRVFGSHHSVLSAFDFDFDFDSKASDHEDQGRTTIPLFVNPLRRTESYGIGKFCARNPLFFAAMTVVSWIGTAVIEITTVDFQTPPPTWISSLWLVLLPVAVVLCSLTGLLQLRSEDPNLCIDRLLLLLAHLSLPLTKNLLNNSQLLSASNVHRFYDG